MAGWIWIDTQFEPSIPSVRLSKVRYKEQENGKTCDQPHGLLLLLCSWYINGGAKFWILEGNWFWGIHIKDCSLY
jgi:hypothetical protein